MEKDQYLYSAFKRDLKRCIRESPSTKDFEDDWKRIIDVYELQENEWLQKLFEIRESWIPIYNRSTFFAGINSFFDSC